MIVNQIHLLIKEIAKFSSAGENRTPMSTGIKFISHKYVKATLNISSISVFAFSILFFFLSNDYMKFKTAIKLFERFKDVTTYLTNMILVVILMVTSKGFSSFENWIYPFLTLPFAKSWNFTIANKFSN